MVVTAASAHCHPIKVEGVIDAAQPRPSALLARLLLDSKHPEHRPAAVPFGEVDREQAEKAGSRNELRFPDVLPLRVVVETEPVWTRLVLTMVHGRTPFVPTSFRGRGTSLWPSVFWDAALILLWVSRNVNQNCKLVLYETFFVLPDPSLTLSS